MPAITITPDKRTLVQLVQDACNELGIPTPNTVVGNVDSNVQQLLALAQREGKEYYSLAHRICGWQQLRTQHLFNTEGTTVTGNVTDGSAVVTGISSTSGLEVGWIVSNYSYFPTETAIVTIDSATQVTLSNVATATSTAVSLPFGQQDYSLPSDFAYFIQQTFWDRAFRWQLLGPLEAQEWQVLKSGISPTGPRRRFRIMGNKFYIDPVPTEVDQEVFEYYSLNWCQSSGGTAQPRWAADTDYYILDDDAFVLGLKWRYLAAKRLPYQEEYNTYWDKVQRNMARNGGNRNLPLNASASGVRLLNSQNVPDTGYGS